MVEEGLLYSGNHHNPYELIPECKNGVQGATTTTTTTMKNKYVVILVYLKINRMTSS
jgi:hypothetical protein